MKVLDDKLGIVTKKEGNKLLGSYTLLGKNKFEKDQQRLFVAAYLMLTLLNAYRYGQ